jgi:hypothetical protein
MSEKQPFSGLQDNLYWLIVKALVDDKGRFWVRNNNILVKGVLRFWQTDFKTW